MGRTLDILKHPRTSPISLRIAPHVSPGSPAAVPPLSEGADEVPFVEVGWQRLIPCTFRSPEVLRGRDNKHG